MSKNKDFLLKAANQLQLIATTISDERASKFGYDMLHGLIEGDADERYDAWIDWMEDPDMGCDTERNGVWVPAIPL